MGFQTRILTILLVVLFLSPVGAQESVDPGTIKEMDIITQGTVVEFGRTACGTVCPERRSLRKAARTADVIFVGTVLSMRSDNGVQRTEADAAVSVVEYAVDEPIKGDAGTYAEVLSYWTGCGYDPAVGSRFLVYSGVSDGRLWTAPVLRTRLADAANDDIGRLRQRFGK